MYNEQDQYKNYDNYSSYYQDSGMDQPSIQILEEEYYELDYNECCLMQHNKVKRNEGNGYHTQLILTNNRIICIEKVSAGFFKTKVIQSIIPISEIKIYNNRPMVNIIRNHNSDKMVEIQLKDGSIETYRVDDHNTRFTKELYKQLYALYGIEVSVENDIFKKIKEELAGNEDLQEVVDNVGDIVKDFSQSVLGINLNRTSTSTTTNQSALTKQQIDSLKSLKDLLDAGILTQEEFEEKKKKILAN